MYEKQEIIIKHYREGDGQRCIAKKLKVSRKTVRKYIEQYERVLKQSEDPSQGQVEYLTTAPAYTAGERDKVRLTEGIQKEINDLVEENHLKKSRGLGKQQLKKCDILEILQEKGYRIGYTSVCNYIREKEGKMSVGEAFIRQEYPPGSSCEFDWGEIRLTLGGRPSRVYLAVFTSANSNYRYAKLYQRQDTLSFMESHVCFFSHVQGVYHCMVYDNMRVAVARFVGPHEKEPTRALTDMKGHYLFSHRFCNAYRGNEKGHVERSVEYIRRKSFARRYHFDSIQEAEAHLQNSLHNLNGTIQQLTGKTARELFDQEKQALWSLPDPLVCQETTQLRADKYATVSYRGNRYSVPEELVGCFVDIRISSGQIAIYNQDQKLGSHPRSYGKHEWVINIEHYLHTFKRKPGALAGSAALSGSNYLKEMYQQFFISCPRDFIDLLHYCWEHRISGERLEESVGRLQKVFPRTITTEKITALLGNKSLAPVKVVPKEDETTSKSKQQLSQVASLFN